jgi:hypothetical protein
LPSNKADDEDDDEDDDDDEDEDYERPPGGVDTAAGRR